MNTLVHYHHKLPKYPFGKKTCMKLSYNSVIENLVWRCHGGMRWRFYSRPPSQDGGESDFSLWPTAIAFRVTMARQIENGEKTQQRTLQLRRRGVRGGAACTTTAETLLLQRIDNHVRRRCGEQRCNAGEGDYYPNPNLKLH